MYWVIALTLIGGCLATPLQQGNLKVVRYTTNREGQYQQNQGIPVAPQPIIYNPQQPIIVEPAPLTYSSFKPVVSEREEQRHITHNVEDEVEAREEAPEDQSRPVEDGRVDSNVDAKEESDGKSEDQKLKEIQNENAALVGTSLYGVKGSQVVNIDQEQVIPTVYGQRRLVEPQPQLYGLKSIPGQSRYVYQAVNNQVPITVEEQRISVPQEQQIPVIQYQAVQKTQQRYQPQQAYVPREWLRPVQPIQHSVKGGQKQIQWYIQPVVPSEINTETGGHIGSQQLQHVPVGQVQPQVLTIPASLQGVKIVQRGPSDQVKVEHAKRQDEQVVQPVVTEQEVPDTDLRPILIPHNVKQQPKVQVLSQQQGVKSVDHTPHHVVVQTTSQRHVPVVSDNRVVSYQLNGHAQPKQIVVQQPVQQAIHHSIQQQGIPISQYSSVPIPNIQQYYQMAQQYPIQQSGHQDISYSVQNPGPVQYSNMQYGQIPIQGVQSYSQVGQVPIQGVQSYGQVPVQSYGQVGQVGSGVQGYSVQPIQVQGVQDVQQVREQPKEHDVRINPLSVDYRQGRAYKSYVGGVKGSSVANV